MRAEDIKEWLPGVINEEEEGTEGAGDKWRLFVSLMQKMWMTGDISFAGSSLSSSQKGGGGVFKGICLLDGAHVESI